MHNILHVLSAREDFEWSLIQKSANEVRYIVPTSEKYEKIEKVENDSKKRNLKK